MASSNSPQSPHISKRASTNTEWWWFWGENSFSLYQWPGSSSRDTFLWKSSWFYDITHLGLPCHFSLGQTGWINHERQVKQVILKNARHCVRCEFQKNETILRIGEEAISFLGKGSAGDFWDHPLQNSGLTLERGPRPERKGLPSDYHFSAAMLALGGVQAVPDPHR